MTCNLYPSKLYEKKGGKKEVKDWWCIVTRKNQHPCQIYWYWFAYLHACWKHQFWHINLQDWANFEGGKLLELARHLVNLTYRTIQARILFFFIDACACIYMCMCPTSPEAPSARNPRIKVLKQIVAEHRGLKGGGVRKAISSDSLALDAPGLEDTVFVEAVDFFQAIQPWTSFVGSLGAISWPTWISSRGSL